MSFLVANFLSEQARAHRSHRVSDPRADLPASQESAGAARGTSASASASVPVVEGSDALSATAPATQESVVREPDGGGGSGTGGVGAVLAGSRPLGPVAGTGTSTRSLSSGAALDASSLVLSCISRAEAMLPPLGSTSTGGGAAHPGLGGMLHVLLLLATGVTETQRGALVKTGFHLKVKACWSQRAKYAYLLLLMEMFPNRKSMNKDKIDFKLHSTIVMYVVKYDGIMARKLRQWRPLFGGWYVSERVGPGASAICPVCIDDWDFFYGGRVAVPP